jgi:hypothetical protein
MIPAVRTLVVFFLVLIGSAPAHAQQGSTSRDRQGAVASEPQLAQFSEGHRSVPVAARLEEPDIRASVVVFGPGPEPHARFGHVGLRFQDPSRDIDVLFDWGRFDFEFPTFFINYALGNLQYAMGSAETSAYLDLYRQMGRRVDEYVLDLPPDQVRAMLLTCIRTDTDAARYYRYDYYRDNCSTRVRDLIDQATAGELKRQLGETVSSTYRSETRRLMPGGLLNWVLSVPIDLAFGPAVDQSISRWDLAFVPMRLAEGMKQVTIDGRPLVSQSLVLEQGNQPAERKAPPAFEPAAMVFGLIIAAMFAVFRRRPRLVLFAAIAWYASLSIGSGLLLFLVLASDHAMARPSPNLLVFSPLAWLVVAGLLRRRWRGLAIGASALIALSSLLAWLSAMFVPGWHATLFAFAAFGPGNLVLAWVLWRCRTGNPPASSTITPV